MGVWLLIDAGIELKACWWNETAVDAKAQLRTYISQQHK